ncbi:hypothetical protein CHK_2797 [Christensenella hongkongensis]|uniref:Uncharacterized protein n=1 Tax=Christensenella hongkongensis TaxID=270498 RepID=A0A0M2NFN7_9FIRM|nr:hypothetical protein CHK_2797 [Christensenella hongkongensis]
MIAQQAFVRNCYAANLYGCLAIRRHELICCNQNTILKTL